MYVNHKQLTKKEETMSFAFPIWKSPHIPKLFLKKTEGCKQITFSNIPFSVAEDKVLQYVNTDTTTTVNMSRTPKVLSAKYQKDQMSC